MSAMTLSEAIRLGSMLHKQGFGNFIEMRRKYLFGFVGPIEFRTCALGAAREATGMLVDTLTTTYPILLVRVERCPVCEDAGRQTVYNMIPHLNDHHRWSRPRIADWVAAQEQAQALALRQAYDEESEACAWR